MLLDSPNSQVYVCLLSASSSISSETVSWPRTGDRIEVSAQFSLTIAFWENTGKSKRKIVVPFALNVRLNIQYIVIIDL